MKGSMNTGVRWTACLITVGLSLVTPAGAVGQSTVYVDADNGDDSTGIGSESAPWRTINFAVTQAELPFSTIDRILIKAGVYDQALEEAAGGFPIELALPLEFEAYDDEDLPVIGGGVENTAVRALFEVVTEAAGQDLQGVVFRNLVFAGENTSGMNAPGALYVESMNGRKVQVVADNCLFRRSEMNDSGGGGHPSIQAIGGYAPAGNNPDASLDLQVVACRFEANAPGGVVVDLGKDCSESGTKAGLIDLTVQDSVFVLEGSQGASAAVDVKLEAYDLTDEENPGPLFGVALLAIQGNVIDSQQASGSGSRFNRGIVIGADVRHGGSVSMNKATTLVQDNQIRGCGLRALAFECTIDGLEGSQHNIQSWRVDRNIITDNLGYGLVIDNGENLTNAYLRVYARGNLITGNGKSGVYVDYGDGGGGGEVGLLWCTLAGNAEYGIEVPSGAVPEHLAYIQNCIVWGNVLGSALGWYPCLNVASGRFQHNIWECFGSACLDAEEENACVASGCNPASGTGYNMDVDPDYVDPGSGNYNLSMGSCGIDRATNTPYEIDASLYTTDIDGESRLWDGDGNGSRVADIGADEYHP